MDREELANILDNLLAGQVFVIGPDDLGVLFPPGQTNGMLDDETGIAAGQFAQDHGCEFMFNNATQESSFVKRPGRWQQLIDNLCNDLRNEEPNAPGFRINIDRQIRQAAERAANAPLNFFGETENQRFNEFLDALRQFLTNYQAINGNEIWREALLSLDSPPVRVRVCRN